jgi:hypothetical protein
VFQHGVGVSFLFAFESAIMQLCYFAAGFLGAPTTYSGYSAFTVANGPHQAQVVPAILDRVPGGWRGALGARRSCGPRPIDTLRTAQRDYFTNWNSLGPHAPVPTRKSQPPMTA